MNAGIGKIFYCGAVGEKWDEFSRKRRTGEAGYPNHCCNAAGEWQEGKAQSSSQRMCESAAREVAFWPPGTYFSPRCCIKKTAKTELPNFPHKVFCRVLTYCGPCVILKTPIKQTGWILSQGRFEKKFQIFTKTLDFRRIIGYT